MILMDIEGNVAPGFQRVAEAFDEHFSSSGEVAAQCCVRQPPCPTRTSRFRHTSLPLLARIRRKQRQREDACALDPVPQGRHQCARADFWIGLPESEEHRVAPNVFDKLALPAETDASAVDMLEFVGPHLMAASTLNGLLPDLQTAALDSRYRRAELGAAGGVASARGLSRVYSWLLNEFTEATISSILHPESRRSGAVSACRRPNCHSAASQRSDTVVLVARMRSPIRGVR